MGDRACCVPFFPPAYGAHFGSRSWCCHSYSAFAFPFFIFFSPPPSRHPVSSFFSSYRLSTRRFFRRLTRLFSSLISIWLFLDTFFFEPSSPPFAFQFYYPLYFSSISCVNEKLLNLVTFAIKNNFKKNGTIPNPFLERF